MDYTTLWKRSALTALLAAVLRSAASAQDAGFAAAASDSAGGQAPRSSRRGSEPLWTDAPQNWGRPIAFRDAQQRMKLTNAQDPAATGRPGPMGDMGNMGTMGQQGDMGQTADPFDIGAAVNQQSATSGFDVGAALAAAPTSSGGRGDSEAAAAQAGSSGTRESGVTDSAAADYTLGNQSEVRATSDAGDLLAKSGSTTNIVVRSVNPVVNDARVRGYRYDQIRSHINGGYFSPVRPDLDSALSRLDGSMIFDVVTIKGPYTVRQGPGFAFVDVSLRPTVRFDDGYQSQGQAGTLYNTNGGQFAANTRVEGGSCDWGYRIGYAQRAGSDYEAGNGAPIAASYNVRNVDMQFSFDFNEFSRLDVGYVRIDGTGIDIPSQVNDIRFGGTDAFYARWVADDQEGIRLAADGWYNRSRFDGNSVNKQNLTPVTGYTSITTNGDVMSTGLRGLATVGAADEHQFTVGADVTYLVQEYAENDFGSAGADGIFGIPRVKSTDPGIFADGKLLVSDRLTARVGGRLDWYSTGYGPGSEVNDGTGAANDSERFNYNLWASYIQLEYAVNTEWTALAGFGAANRAPNPTELFAFAPYVGLFQQGGATFINGSNPFVSPAFTALDQEYARQIDFSLKADYEDFRGGVGFFHSWVNNFITYDPLVPSADPTTDEAFDVLNTNATLAGGDAYFEADLSERLTAFGNVFYVEGRDQTAQVALWGVAPLQSTLGFRLNEDRWGMEYGARMVAAQDRVNDGTGLNNISRVREVATGGFTTHYVSGYYKATEKLTFTGGVQNMFDRNYREHLDSRVDLSYGTPGGVLRPGRSFYFGANVSF